MGQSWWKAGDGLWYPPGVRPVATKDPYRRRLAVLVVALVVVAVVGAVVLVSHLGPAPPPVQLGDPPPVPAGQPQLHGADIGTTRTLFDGSHEVQVTLVAVVNPVKTSAGQNFHLDPLATTGSVVGIELRLHNSGPGSVLLSSGSVNSGLFVKLVLGADVVEGAFDRVSPLGEPFNVYAPIPEASATAGWVLVDLSTLPSPTPPPTSVSIGFYGTPSSGGSLFHLP